MKDFNLKEFLEMGEEELYNYLWCNKIQKADESLADLAIRLRDEAVKNYKNKWGPAKEKVALIACPGFDKLVGLIDGLGGADEAIISARNGFFVNTAQPIHWIAAALEAMKEAE